MKSELPIPLLPQLLGRRVREAEERAGRIHEAVIGLVVDIKDPDRLGRVKVRFPDLPGQDTSWWAPLSALGAGPDRGWWFLPEIDDEVLVMFEHGDVSRPIIIGALWNGKDLPPEKNGGGNERRMIVSRNDSKFIFDDDKGLIIIEDGKGVGRITISTENKITLEAMQGDVTLSAPAGEVAIVAGDSDLAANEGLNVQAGTSLNMGAPSVTVGGSRVTVSAGRLDLNPGGVAGPAEASASPEDIPDPV
jgi:uncharacterized protein involved in type VI secretion and phage assembly